MISVSAIVAFSDKDLNGIFELCGLLVKREIGRAFHK